MSPEELQRMAADARPRLAWRIGVSGHRTLDERHLKGIREAVARVLADVGAALKTVQGVDHAATVFSSEVPMLTVLSALAVGADRMLAEAAVNGQLRLVAPLPFAARDYRRDFPQSTEQFERYLRYAQGHGGVVELDGDYASEATRNRAYMAVGEFTVRNCDLLLAIWNGDDARGLGGTGDVVAYARDRGVPVVHIQSDKPADIRILGATGEAATPYSRDAIAALVRAQVLPDPPMPRIADPVRRQKEFDRRKKRQIEDSKQYFTGERLSYADRPLDFLYSGPFAPRTSLSPSILSWLFPSFVRLFGHGAAVSVPVKRDPPYGKADPCARHLFAHHHRADVLASFYANLHRSAFLLVYVLGAAALSCAVAALFTMGHKVPWIGWKAEYFFTGLELVILIALGALVRTDNWLRWRDRWLEYRLLAELLREADLLAQIGRPMPIATIDELAEDLPGRAWVRTAYCAIVRAAGFASLTFDKALLEDLRDYAADTRLADQIAYHERAMSRNEDVAHVLRLVGEVAFGLTVVAAIVKLSWHSVADLFALGLLAGILPALAYASFGIRNQAEFEIVGRRSERMIIKLERHSHRLKALAGERLTSPALGREMLRASAVMRHDAADWASIFEVKGTEA